MAKPSGRRGKMEENCNCSDPVVEQEPIPTEEIQTSEETCKTENSETEG